MQNGGKYDKIDDIISFIKLKYVDTVNTDSTHRQCYGKCSLPSILTQYISLRKNQEQTNESLDGNFEGVGIEFYIVQDTITVVSSDIRRSIGVGRYTCR
jgi:carboxyl-terminal processing protease